MNLLLLILGLASLGVTLQKTEWFANTLFDRRPFNCTLCLTTWASFAYLCFNYWSLPFVTIIMIASSAGVLAEFIDQKTNPFK